MTEKMKNERDQEIASLEEQMRNGEGMALTFAPTPCVRHFVDHMRPKGSGDFARDRINFELVHRSSYQGTYLHLCAVCAVSCAVTCAVVCVCERERERELTR
jgi:hypothetical protein